MIAAVGLVLLVGLVALVPVVGAAQNDTSWDKYQQCTIGCNESYGGTGTFKQGGSAWTVSLEMREDSPGKTLCAKENSPADYCLLR